MSLLEYMIAAALVLLFAGLYIGSAAWAVSDAQRRGDGSGVVFFLFWLLGPFSALVWLLVRPTRTLRDQLTTDFSSAEDAMSTASKMATLGEWDAAKELYRRTAVRWPEHQDYIQNCVDAIEAKHTLASGRE